MNKSIKKNYILNFIYEVFALLVPIFVMPYISRILGADGVGIYSYTYSIIYYFMLLGALGFTTYSRREMAKIRDNFEKQKNVYVVGDAYKVGNLRTVIWRAWDVAKKL